MVMEGAGEGGVGTEAGSVARIGLSGSASTGVFGGGILSKNILSAFSCQVYGA